MWIFGWTRNDEDSLKFCWEVTEKKGCLEKRSVIAPLISGWFSGKLPSAKACKIFAGFNVLWLQPEPDCNIRIASHSKPCDVWHSPHCSAPEKPHLFTSTCLRWLENTWWFNGFLYHGRIRIKSPTLKKHKFIDCMSLISIGEVSRLQNCSCCNAKWPALKRPVVSRPVSTKPTVWKMAACWRSIPTLRRYLNTSKNPNNDEDLCRNSDSLWLSRTGWCSAPLVGIQLPTSRVSLQVYQCVKSMIELGSSFSRRFQPICKIFL